MNDLPPSPKRILIVDDEVRVSFVLRESLKKLGENYQIVTTNSPIDALERVRAQPFDLVITDYKMEPIDGIALAREIQSFAPATRIVLITAYGSAEVEEKAEQVNVFRYLIKPFPMEEIRQVAQEAIQSLENARPRTDAYFLTDSQQIELRKLLVQLCDETACQCIFLIDNDGHLIATAGSTEGLNLSVLASMIAGNFIAAREIARLLRQNLTLRLSSYEGDNNNICACRLDDRFLLVTVFKLESRPDVAQLPPRPIAEELPLILRERTEITQIRALLNQNLNQVIQNEVEQLLQGHTS